MAGTRVCEFHCVRNRVRALHRGYVYNYRIASMIASTSGPWYSEQQGPSPCLRVACVSPSIKKDAPHLHRVAGWTCCGTSCIAMSLRPCAFHGRAESQSHVILRWYACGTVRSAGMCWTMPSPNAQLATASREGLSVIVLRAAGRSIPQPMSGIWASEPDARVVP